MFEIVHRNEVPTVHTVEVGGREHWLGVLKDFRKNDQLRRFLPASTGASIAWVRLEADEVLEVHTHPVASLILLTRGTGRAIGDVEAALEEGDAVLVPAGARHGFVGTGEGFWGITVQFEPRGLYEDARDPWVTFIRSGAERPAPGDAVDRLLAANSEHLERFAAHPVFVLAKAGQFDHDEIRRRFLDCLAVWSQAFQRMLAQRVEASRDPAFQQLALEHQREELGHDKTLPAVARGVRVFDPQLEALSEWFVHQMHQLDDVGQAVLTHLVVEGAANVFYARMARHLSVGDGAAHFSQHGEVDTHHQDMATGALRAAKLTDVAQHEALLAKGWSMMRALVGRMAELALRT